jgi:hypothetical protein
MLTRYGNFVCDPVSPQRVRKPLGKNPPDPLLATDFFRNAATLLLLYGDAIAAGQAGMLHGMGGKKGDFCQAKKTKNSTNRYDKMTQ